MKVVPFGKNIPPSCVYCEFGLKKPDHIYCFKKNKKITDKKCIWYRYDPLKRIPNAPLELPEYKKEDFKI